MPSRKLDGESIIGSSEFFNQKFFHFCTLMITKFMVVVYSRSVFIITKHSSTALTERNDFPKTFLFFKAIISDFSFFG